ncbi:MAG: hypothetical protein A2Z88_01155 [Omnitrophica WOR_2 bacterium GWA2_47_8]|nr:MAG: hypothetical protein A2Z88_01155 [Omnitrophica WOR_2 bacterium GWA2_47_8]
MSGISKLTLNIEENSASLHISPEIYKRVLQKAVLQTAQDIKALEEALPVGDFEKVKAISHKFKGDYDNLRLKDMSSVAKEMSDCAKTSQDKEKIAHLLETFSAYFDQLKEQMDK